MSEIKVGDRVRITYTGACHSTYDEFIEKHGLKNYEPYCLGRGDIGTVILIGDHDYTGGTLLVIKNEDTDEITLYGVRGVEKVDDEVKTLRDKVASEMPDCTEFIEGKGRKKVWRRTTW